MIYCTISALTCTTSAQICFQGLDYTTTFLHFLDIPETITNLVPDTPRATVPCITDTNGKTIQDSRRIALYLEEKYPEPSIFQGGEGVHFFFEDWAMERIMHKPFLISLLKLYSELDEEAQVFYRESREAMFGTTLEKFAGDPEEHLTALNEALSLVAKTLAQYDFLTGDQPGWADIVLASHLILLDKFHPEILAERVLSQHEHLEVWWKRMQNYADCDN